MNKLDQIPPLAKTIPHSFEKHGHIFTDEYAWLQNKDDPDVIAYLEAENAYAKAALKHTELLQEQLFQEMRSRIQEDDSSAPEKRGEYDYYWRVQAGLQYRIFCRKYGSLDAPEQIILDENVLAEGKTYCKVYVFEPSPDQNLLAFAVDTTGALVFDLYIKHMSTGELVNGPIPNTAWNVAWASDSRTLFYTVFNDSHRPFKLFRHIAGEDPANDILIYHELDESFPIYIQRSRSGEYLLLTIESGTTSEVRYLPASQPTREFRIVHPRQHWLEYYLEHAGDRFWITTNESAENFRLMVAPTDNPGKENWREVLPHRLDTYIEQVSAFRNHLVVYERQAGLKRIRISDSDGLSNIKYIGFPDPVYTFRIADNPEFDAPALRFYYSSLVTPVSTIDFDLANNTWEVKKRQEIPGGYDKEQYASERLFAQAPDGEQVPIALVYRKGSSRNGKHPTLLYGYGSYGFSNEPDFDSKRLSLLDRGFVFAIAHIRGGSEMGRAWYEDGRLMQKKNTFTDFIASAEHLIAQGYTSPEQLAIMGRSAGGLLVSAVTNMRPELFNTVIAQVPFTNVITAMLSPDLPLTVIEYEQWGNPDDPKAFEYMLSYSPYENVEAKAYPHIYAQGGLNDLQVPYWDPAKWVAKLRAHKTDNNRLFLITNMGAGHGGASGRYDYLREVAQVYAFMIETIGVSHE
jgi:oligopeptidase B